MDAPAMLTRKHVPEDVGLRNIAEDEAGGQGQLHRDEKQHKPVLKKVKEKVKKIKNTLAGHGHGHGHGHDGGDERVGDDSTASEEGDEDALEREAALEKGGYMDDVEDKPVGMEPDPEVHGAPMYESARAPAVQDHAARMPAVHDPMARFEPTGMPAVHDPMARHAPAFPPAAHDHTAKFGTTGMPATHDPMARYEPSGMPAVHDPTARHAPAFPPAAHDPMAGYAQAGVPASHDPAARFEPTGTPAVHDPVARSQPTGMAAVLDPVERHEPARIPAVQEVEGDDASKVRLGDLGGPVVEDPAAPRSKTRAAREGEDIGTTPVVQAFENMTVSDEPPHVGAAKKGARAEEWKDEAAEKVGGASGGASYTDKLKNAAAGTTEYGKKLASTVYEKVAGVGGAASDNQKDATSASDAGREEWKDTTSATEAADRANSGGGYTDKIKSAAAGTTEYGKQIATTVYDKVAGVGSAVAPNLRSQGGTGERDAGRSEAMPVSEPNAGGEDFADAAATHATDGASGTGYTEKIKSVAAGTTEYGKQLASTVYGKVAGVGSAVAPKLRPQESLQEGVGEQGAGRNEATPVSESDTGREEFNDATAAAQATDGGASGAGYTGKIKSAAAGTTEYGKQLATTVYEKVAGVGTAVAGKVQQATHSAGTATPGVGTQRQDTSATAAPGAGGAQDKGVTVTGYIADKLRPSDEDRALSQAITGAVQRRKEDVGGTVAQRVPAPGQVIAKAREVVTSLTGGGNRVSEVVAVQPTTTVGDDAKEGVTVAAVEEPVLHGEEVRGAKLNTNTM
ncbi:hypothetical protein ACP4OV_002777 [Aristida adscensionis]